MIKHHWNTYLLLGLLGAGIWGCSSRAEVSNNDTPVDNRLPVDIVIAKETKLQQQEVLAGTILPYQEVLVTSEVARRVISAPFKEGTLVSKGQLLYQLDSVAAKALVTQARAALSLARLNEKRLASLRASESVSVEEYDAAFSQLIQLEAAYDLALNELKKTSIRAPFAGRVGISKVHQGTLVQPGSPLVSLAETERVRVQFSVPEKYVHLIRVGLPVTLSTSSTSNGVATVVALEPTLDESTRSLTVQAIAHNTNGTYYAGMSAKVFFSSVDEKATGITLPTHALIPGADGYSVFVVRNGMAAITPVSVGNRSDQAALISAGIHHGDSVIVSNILRASPGTPIVPVTIK